MGEKPQEKKMVKDVICAALLCLATVSPLEHLRQFLGSELSVTLQKLSWNHLFPKHYAINHEFGFPSCWDYTHSTDKKHIRIQNNSDITFLLTPITKQCRHTRPFQLQHLSCYPVDHSSPPRSSKGRSCSLSSLTSSQHAPGCRTALRPTVITTAPWLGHWHSRPE